MVMVESEETFDVAFREGVDVASALVVEAYGNLPEHSDLSHETVQYYVYEDVYEDAELRSDTTLRADVYDTIVNWWPRPLHDRFVRLFVQSAVVSHLARVIGGHRHLSREELRGYLAHSVVFHNTWTWTHDFERHE